MRRKNDANHPTTHEMETDSTMNASDMIAMLLCPRYSQPYSEKVRLCFKALELILSVSRLLRDYINRYLYKLEINIL